MEPNPQTPDPASPEETLDARGAAALLDKTSREARRQLNAHPPAMSIVQAAVVLVIYGTIWFSVRDQHPYRGPSLSAVGFVYIMVAVVSLIAVSVYYRAIQGVSGRSRHEERMAAVPLLAAIVGVYTFVGALGADGFGDAIVYGVVDAAAPWLVIGAVLAGMGAAREDRWQLAGGLALIAVGAGAAFAGPADVWGVLAVAGCVLLLAQGAVRLTSARRQ